MGYKKKEAAKTTLVIHPKDSTTDFLRRIYDGRGWTEVTADVSNDTLRYLLRSHKRIVMLGHGTPDGMFGHGGYVIDHSHTDLLREKEVVAIWCNADKYVEQHNLHGIYTGMMISEMQEAKYMDVLATEAQIDFSNTLFSEAMREAIDQPQPAWVAKARYHVPHNPIIAYNRARIYYLKAGSNTMVEEGKE